MSAEERAPHLQFSKDAAMKRGDTVLNSVVDDDTLTQFEEQKRNLNVEFQDIEDQIVWFYLMTKPLACSTKDIRETIQTPFVATLHNSERLVRDINVRNKSSNEK